MLEAIDLSTHGDRIYFLNTGGADAILIESEGKFALVDGAEDSDNPRGFEDLAFDGTEDYVVDYQLIADGEVLYNKDYTYGTADGGYGIPVRYDLPENFLDPYASRSVSEFYRRWHVTLGLWFRKYVYIPWEATGKVPSESFSIWRLSGC